MSNEVRQSAEKFVAEQVDIMSKHGTPPSLTHEKREELVMAAARRFEALSQA